MSSDSLAPPPPETLEAFCLAVLTCGDLATKLRPPTGPDGSPLPDTPAAPIVDIERPARDAALAMGPGGGALPAPSALGEAEARKECLSRFAHHELQAVEYFAWALLRWPDAPAELRRGLVSALTDEQRHCRLYLDRLAALGGTFATGDHSDYFWQQAPAIADADAGLRAFLAAIGLTLEQANLDFTLTYRDAFREAGDDESAAICQVVHDDEVAHVALAVRWLRRLSGGEDASDADLRDYLETVPFPLGPARAKGRRFEAAPRKRAGLSEALIEHVRDARVGERETTPIELLPNLGAEEGDADRAYRDQPPVRTAAHLWALLFPRRARLALGPEAKPGPEVRSLWPKALGAPPSRAIFDFLDGPGPHAWLATTNAFERCPGLAATTSAPDVVDRLHDKAFAAEQAEALGLVHRSLAPLIEVLDADALAPADTVADRLEARLAEWPEWTGARYTLKPRHGSSGRGRVGGRGTVDREKLGGALPRLAARGGAIFEPWLDRTEDLSVSLFVPPEGEEHPLVVLGSLEMWTSPSGGYRGHFGEVDSRGRVFSGDVDDETLRGDAAAIASRARAAGYAGPCGVDAFRYLQPMSDGDPVARLRGAVEFNARPTMGLVAIGLVKRAFPRVRKRLGLQPGDRHGFALTHRPADDDGWRAGIYEHVGNDAVIVDLAEASGPGDPRASLVFSPDPASIRAARREAFRC
ncbi:MAG: ferritin-like domain-containing protein [bacterium]|nr:ferritin-like domain-containing protein [bacterium]